MKRTRKSKGTRRQEVVRVAQARFRNGKRRQGYKQLNVWVPGHLFDRAKEAIREVVDGG